MHSEVSPGFLNSSGFNVIHYPPIRSNQDGSLVNPTVAWNVNINLQAVPSVRTGRYVFFPFNYSIIFKNFLY